MVASKQIRIGVAVLIWALFMPAVFAFAQESTPLRPLEPSNTTSPAATLNSLIDSCNELGRLIKDGALTQEREGEVLPTAERILDCLDLSDLPKELRDTAGIESALFLKEVLDRIELPADGDIPSSDDLKSSEDGPQLRRWLIPETRIAISRVEQGPAQNAYLFTPESVRNAAHFYRIVKGLPYRTEGRVVSPNIYDDYIAATKKKPAQTADTSSPRGTMTLFLDSCDQLYAEIGKDRYMDRSNPVFQQLGMRIISCLDTSQLPEFAREYFDGEAAVSLKEVLDRVQLPTAEEIPGIESVEAADGTEALTRWQVPRTQIVISKIVDGPRRGEFLFSADTVRRAPDNFRKLKSQPYRKEGRPVSAGFYEWWLSRPADPIVAKWIDGLPEWYQDRYFKLAIWQWISLLVIVPICLIAMAIAFRFGRTHHVAPSDGRALIWHWLSLAFPLFAILIPLAFKHFIWQYLTLRGSSLYVVSFGANLVFLMGLIVLIVRVSSRVAESFVALPGISPSGLDANLIRIICRVTGIAASIVVLLEGGRYLGFPLTTLIASAGIGGLAIALSAQGLIKGMFGTVTILLDKPYRVGERINVKGHSGVVEEIGLRSTKIRALDERVISIPNDLMAEAEIENIGKHNSIRQITNLHIPLDTPRAHVEKAVACIRTVLEDHDGMVPELPARVNFTDFNSDSFNVRVTYWFSPPVLSQFHEFSEKTNLSIMRSFEEHGIQFSLPFRHSYWKTDDQQGPLDVDVTSGKGE